MLPVPRVTRAGHQHFEDSPQATAGASSSSAAAAESDDTEDEDEDAMDHVASGDSDAVSRMIDDLIAKINDDARGQRHVSAFRPREAANPRHSNEVGEEDPHP